MSNFYCQSATATMPVLSVSGNRFEPILPMKIARVDLSRPAQAVATAVMASG
jgi:hypothetical protein